ncbi:MAG: phosphate signaling complex protein PhoU [Sphingomonas sp.]|uniref:phosphate signaling complex protein PhoU n=1 Tax=Sphingomonas sp. TaxID=28214 RepID=UPI0025DCB5B1|nr:phosphate signaling complex protein PhoU [Sphingomonas sp.]MBX3566393.1 phosphate signaling complex protein PhoU [Sphingomonas sp.]
MATRFHHDMTPLDREIGEVRAQISQMGGLAEQAIHDAMKALQRNDTDLAEEVRKKDKTIDAIESGVERLALGVITSGTASPEDLREMVGALKIAAVIERIGDYAKNIAKRVRLIHGDDRIEAVSLLPAMAQLAGDMVHDVLDAFAARDPAAAIAVWERDRVLDDFYESIFRTLVTFMVENPRTVGQVSHLLFVAKNIERIGDHATNVAEMVYFAATGDYLADRETGASAG